MIQITPLPLILGSQSPRRKQLLESAGFQVSIQIKDTDESTPFDLPPKEIPTYLAEKKSKPFEDLSIQNIIITADTIVLLDDEVLGKPKDTKDATRMLQKLSGRHHQVITGVCILTQNEYHTFKEITNVYFRTLTINEINTYIEEYKPYDKAGAYGVQEGIGLWGVSRIEGDFYTVMGFPVCRFMTELNLVIKKHFSK